MLTTRQRFLLALTEPDPGTDDGGSYDPYVTGMAAALRVVAAEGITSADFPHRDRIHPNHGYTAALALEFHRGGTVPPPGSVTHAALRLAGFDA